MEWRRVGRKGVSHAVVKWDVFPYGGMQKVGKAKAVVSSFYISEFPVRTRAEDLFKLFGCVGDVVEVVIPPKRNKFGKRFGFARFVGVVEDRLLAVKLDNIMIDGKKIYANQPRFARGEGSRGVEGKRSISVPQKKLGGRDQVMVAGGKSNFVRGGVSFASVASSEGRVLVGSPEVTEKFSPGIVFSSSDQCRARWKKSYVAEVIFPGETYNIQTHLEVEGFFLVKVIPLGAKLCVLEELEEGVIQELISDGCSWWKQWFRSITPWKEADIDDERMLWIRVIGVPCHAWCTDFFESIGNSLGAFVCVDDNTSSGGNMDMARLLLRVPYSFNLEEKMKVRIDDMEYSLILREDTYGPIRNVNKSALPSIRSETSMSSTSDKASVFSGFADYDQDEEHGGAGKNTAVFVEKEGFQSGMDRDVVIEVEEAVLEKKKLEPEYLAEKDNSLGKEVLYSKDKDNLCFDVELKKVWERKSDQDISKSCSDPISLDHNSVLCVRETGIEKQGLSDVPLSSFNAEINVESKRSFLLKKGTKSKTLLEVCGDPPVDSVPPPLIKSVGKKKGGFKNMLNFSKGPPNGSLPLQNWNAAFGDSGPISKSQQLIEAPAESDICRCNNRILENFDWHGDRKLKNLIAGLGVVGGDSKSDANVFNKDLKVLDSGSEEISEAWMEKKSNMS